MFPTSCFHYAFSYCYFPIYTSVPWTIRSLYNKLKLIFQSFFATQIKCTFGMTVLTCSYYTIKISSFFLCNSYATEFQFTKSNISVLLLSINEAIICNSIIMHFFSHWINIYWLFKFIFWLKELETLLNTQGCIK